MEVGTGFKEKGVRAWRDKCMASDMDGFPLCVGVGCPYVRLPVTRFRFSVYFLD